MTLWRYAFALLALLFAPPLYSGDEAPTPAPQVAPGEYASPRATMTTFLSALADAKGQGPDRTTKPARVQDAVKCLDLSKIEPLIRKDKSTELAWTLLEVLDRTWRVDVAQIDVAPEEAVFRRLLVRDGIEYGEVVIARQTDGAWLFEGNFVAGLPSLFARVRHLKLLEGQTGSDGHSFAMWLRQNIPTHLTRKTFLLEHWQWLGLLLLIGLGIIVERLVGFLIGSYFRRFVKSRGLLVDEEKSTQAEKPLGLVAMAAVWWTGLYWLGLPERVDAMLLTAAKFFAAACGVWSAYRLVDLVCAYLAQVAARTDSKMDDLLVPLVRKTLKIFVAVFGLVFIADTLGLPITTMLAGLGIGGIAFALAAKDTVENLFGSLTVLIDRPFQIGDFVRINDVEGTIEEVGFRSTRIRTPYNSLVTMANSKLVNANVDNLGARDKRRVRCNLALAHTTTPERIEVFCAGVRELLQRHPLTEKESNSVNFHEFSTTSLDVMLNFFLLTRDYRVETAERERILLDVIRLADRLGVEFARPMPAVQLESAALSATQAPPRRREIDQARELDEMLRIGQREAADLAAKYNSVIVQQSVLRETGGKPPGVSGT